MYSSTAKDDNVASLKNSAYAAGKEELDGAKDELRAAANKAGKKVRNFIDTASTEISQAADTVNARVHEKPMQSSLIALGIGFVLGALLRR